MKVRPKRSIMGKWGKVLLLGCLGKWGFCAGHCGKGGEGPPWGSARVAMRCTKQFPLHAGGSLLGCPRRRPLNCRRGSGRRFCGESRGLWVGQAWGSSVVQEGSALQLLSKRFRRVAARLRGLQEGNLEAGAPAGLFTGAHMAQKDLSA